MWAWKNSDKVESKYPDMKLYQEIIFLQNYFNGQWTVENVIPYYMPLILPSYNFGRHLFWCNFIIQPFNFKEADINGGNKNEWIKLHGFDLTDINLGQRKDQIYRNCVHPLTGEHILNCALNIEKVTQLTLFNLQSF
jgi:DNA (cytosine-5)-methyltransferase 1